jgi:hypothetical protein
MSRHHRPPRPQRLARTGAPLLLAALLALALALAPAALGKPTGEFAVFAECPLSTKGVNECVYAQFTGGELRVGKMDVPVEHTITLQGGLVVVESPPSETFVNAAGGNTLSKTAEKVSGGLGGIERFESDNELNVVLELVGPVSLSRTNLADASGVALDLPSRLHLENPFLGESCYVGSSSKPLELSLTTGKTSPPEPNKPITGSPGEKEFKDSGALVVYKNDSLVNNSFSAPEAKGCGGFEESLIDPIINSKFGLPVSAGHNTAILKGTSEFATAEAVRASE